MVEWRSARRQYFVALLISSFVSVGFFAYGAVRNESAQFSYLVWNLFLAWIPLLLAVRLVHVLRYKLWSTWEAMSLSALWLVFLPNSFYMISDFIHLQEVKRIDILYDTLMFTSFIYTGVVLGFSSLYLVHSELRKRMPEREAAAWVGLTLAVCSGAIYIGRDLRWNSWDILTNPGGLLFDVSDRIAHISTYPHMLLTVISFFILLSSMYLLLWQGIKMLDSLRHFD